MSATLAPQAPHHAASQAAPQVTPDPLAELTRTVIERMGDAPDARFRQIMTTLVGKLHEFLHEVDLKPEEWFRAIEFLTATGQACTDKRQEFILLSDTLGASMTVVMLDQARALREGQGAGGATESTELAGATEATVEGPFYWPGAPEYPLGADISGGASGEPTYYSGVVTDTEGQPIANALLDLWSGDGDGNYDMQIAGAEMSARGKIHTDDQGRYRFWSIRPTYYPVPEDGPVGAMLRRMGRHPNRPGHIHMKVSAAGHAPVTTHLFVANSPFIDSDAVFGVRDSLIIDFQRHEPGRAPDGKAMAQPYWQAHYDFRLGRAKA